MGDAGLGSIQIEGGLGVGLTEAKTPNAHSVSPSSSPITMDADMRCVNHNVVLDQLRVIATSGAPSPEPLMTNVSPTASAPFGAQHKIRIGNHSIFLRVSKTRSKASPTLLPSLRVFQHWILILCMLL